MAYKITDKDNTDPADGKYLYGNIKDDSGIDDGTPVDKKTYADMHQFFARLMEKAIENDLNGFDWNHLPDNNYDSFQLYEALLKTKPYKYYVALLTQSGSSAPTSVVLENNIGSIVWTRSNTGDYRATLSGKFTANKTWVGTGSYFAGSGGAIVAFFWADVNTLYLRTYDASNALSDNVLTNHPIEIRVYP